MSKPTIETNLAENELRKMMFDLHVDETVDSIALRASFLRQIREHHTDKGGSEEKAKELTRAFRVLKAYLDQEKQLPKKFGFTEEPSTSRSGCRPNYRATQSCRNPFEFSDDEDFQPFQHRKTRRKRQPNGQRRRNESAPREDPYFLDSSNDEEDNFRLDLSKKRFANNYQYTNDDLSGFKDIYENRGPAGDHLRIIRGGLTLREDFTSGNAVSEYSELHFRPDFDDVEFFSNPEFEPILEKLKNDVEDTFIFGERLKTMINLDWALSEEFQTQSGIKSIRLQKGAGGSVADVSVYEFTLPDERIQEIEFFSAGIHVNVRSTVDERVHASAIVDSVNVVDKKVQLFFLDQYKIQGVLTATNVVNIDVNASAFVYRSLLRSIEFVQRRRMENFVFPSLDFRERRAEDMQQLEFLEVDGYNDFQKFAVYSILTNVHRPYPFIVFGPPGTGKTVTLIESIRQLVLQSKNNRILVCTPSRMAADSFAETLLEKMFIKPKYVFRMHSLSTSALGRNHMLDPISFLPHIFIDECGQATEADTWIPIGGLATEQTSIILSGDPKQLGPVVNTPLLRTFGYGQSMLKRLMYSAVYDNSDDRAMVVLKQTYRSHFRILRPCSYLFYNNMLMANEADNQLYKLCEWEGLPTKGFPIVFVSSVMSFEEQGTNRSFSNDFEAQMVVRYVQRVLAETDVAAKDIGVITPYKNQVIKLRKLLHDKPQLTIDSVEGFQGSEREVIIISTVRTGKLGFLQCDLRMNTSISRAKSLLIVIGNDDVLKQHISWRKFIYYCRYHGGYLDYRGEKRTDLDALTVGGDD